MFRVKNSIKRSQSITLEMVYSRQLAQFEYKNTYRQARVLSVK